MGDIIFTLTSVSRALCAFDRPPGSTLDSIIQISSRFEQAIVELGTTSERMVTSFTRSATRLIQIGGPRGAAATLYGLRLYAESEEEFYSILRDGARDIISYITDNSNNTPRSSMEFVHNHTNRQPYGPYWTERIAEWKSQATIGDNGGGHRRRSLILWGPTRTGKTVRARSLGTLTLPGWGSAPAPPFHIPH